MSDYRGNDAGDTDIDLATAVDVAIRDLREILSCWGTEAARQRAQECELTLLRVGATPVRGAIRQDHIGGRFLAHSVYFFALAWVSAKYLSYSSPTMILI